MLHIYDNQQETRGRISSQALLTTEFINPYFVEYRLMTISQTNYNWLMTLNWTLLIDINNWAAESVDQDQTARMFILILL